MSPVGAAIDAMGARIDRREDEDDRGEELRSKRWAEEQAGTL